MPKATGDTCGRNSPSNALSGMVKSECDKMTVHKHMYDVDYPDNAKNISSEQVREIARKKIIQELAAPLCSTDEN
jgi:hypothetical protein